MRWFFLLTAVVMVWAQGSVSWALEKDFILVDNGVAKCAIVLPEQASAQETLAAAELAKYVQLISGAQIPIKNEPYQPTGFTIYVGKTQAATQKPLEIPVHPLSQEGFVVKTLTNELFIVGSTDQCTLFGAYDFLEQLGCRFYLPGESGEVIPQKKTLVIGPLDIAEKPAMLSRNINLWGYKVRSIYQGTELVGYTAPTVPIVSDEKLFNELMNWATKNKLGGAPLYTSHSWTRVILKPEIFAPEHPEYFSLVNGQRLITPPSVQLCTTHPDVIRLYAEAAVKFFDQFPEYLSFSISPSDAVINCECDACRALDDPRRPGDHTRRLAIFSNEVAKLVAPKYPDKYLASYMSYTDDLTAPPADVPMEKNIIPGVVNNLEYVSQWTAKGTPPLFYVWMLFLDELPFAQNPYQVTNLIQRAYHDGAMAFFIESDHIPFDFPATYLIMRIGWDGKVDIQKELEEFYDVFYGPAAGEMQQFADKISSITAADQLPDCAELLAQAEAASPDTIYARRVQKMHSVFGIYEKYFLMMNKALAALNSGDAQKLDEFKHTYQTLVGELEGETGQMLPRRATMLNKVKSSYGVLAADAPRTSFLKQKGSYLWGDFFFKIDGVMRASEAVRLDGVNVTTTTIALEPHSSGSVEWEFQSPPNTVFQEAEISLLALDCPKAAIAVTDANGAYQVVAREGASAPIKLDDRVAGRNQFRLKVSGSNDTASEVYFVEDLRVQFQTAESKP